MVLVTHYGVCGTDGLINGQFVPAGSIIATQREAEDKADALKWLQGDKRFIHKVLDHRKSLNTCRDDICGTIQTEIDSLGVAS
jgi:hypothetical protein